MATPKDPNKTLLEEQAVVDANQRTKDGQTATVSDGQIIEDDGSHFLLDVEGGAVVGVDSVTVPNAPTSPVATGGDAQASVAFTAPANNGGHPISSYTVTSTPGGLTASGPASPIVVTGLTNGVAYTFKVKATNGVGTGAESAASSAVTPSA